MAKPKHHRKGPGAPRQSREARDTSGRNLGMTVPRKPPSEIKAGRATRDAISPNLHSILQTTEQHEDSLTVVEALLAYLEKKRDIKSQDREDLTRMIEIIDEINAAAAHAKTLEEDKPALIEFSAEKIPQIEKLGPELLDLLDRHGADLPPETEEALRATAQSIREASAALDDEGSRWLLHRNDAKFGHGTFALTGRGERLNEASAALDDKLAAAELAQETLEHLDVRGPTNPTQALDMHLELWEHCDSPMHEDIIAQTIGATSPDLGYTQNAKFYAYAEAAYLNEATTLYVTDEMTDFAIRERIPQGTPTLRQIQVPWPHGLAVLGGNITYPDFDVDIVREYGAEFLVNMPVRALGWCTADDISTPTGPAPGIVIWTYLDRDGIDAMGAAWKRRGVAEELNPRAHAWRDAGAPRLILMDFAGWAFDREWTLGDEEEHATNWTHDKCSPHIATQRLQLLATFQLCMEWLPPRPPASPRPAVRRNERAGRIPEDGEIKVYHLRKLTPGPPRDTLGDTRPGWQWNHAVIKRGHWRRLRDRDTGDWSYDEHGEIRKAWIPAHRFPKDESLPLVIKEKVRSLDR